MHKVGTQGWYMIDEIDLVGLVADHAGLARLCAELESFADGLPSMPEAEDMYRLGDELENRLPTHEAREIATFDTMFERAATSCANALLNHVRARRAAYVVQAQDLVPLLKGDSAMPCGETLGFMLRCFFQSCREAMAFEELVVLHLGSHRLTSAASALLRGSLEARCQS